MGDIWKSLDESFRRLFLQSVFHAAFEPGSACMKTYFEVASAKYRV